MAGVFMSKRARAARLVVIATLVVFTWLSRATVSGFPDRIGWVAMAIFAVAGVNLLSTKLRRL